MWLDQLVCVGLPGHWAVATLLVIVSSAAVHAGAHPFLGDPAFDCSGDTPSSGMVGRGVILLFSKKPLCCPSQQPHQFTFPPTVRGVPVSLCACHTCGFALVLCGVCVCVRVCLWPVSPYGFDRRFPDSWQAERFPWSCGPRALVSRGGGGGTGTCEGRAGPAAARPGPSLGPLTPGRPPGSMPQRSASLSTSCTRGASSTGT